MFSENRFEGRGYVHEVDDHYEEILKPRSKDDQPFANNDFPLITCLFVVFIMATLKDFK